MMCSPLRCIPVITTTLILHNIRVCVGIGLPVNIDPEEGADDEGNDLPPPAPQVQDVNDGRAARNALVAGRFAHA